ncbi:hypothetical protein [uncultured Trichococcus sp.]|uniref:hypothetical protein n=1 Tax=uncultured Trichococcus sp. TaxID=189665 RepID=UPI002A186A98|nr:hypothetical protein [uncultured Trichococcus sp.]
MVKIGEKTVVSVTCQDVILQLAEQYCSEEEYLHFGMKENPRKYVLVTDEKIYLIKSKARTEDRHKEDVFSIQYTQMRKEELRMKFDGWFVEMSTNSAAKKEPHFHVVLDKIQGLRPDENETSLESPQPVLPDYLDAEIHCLKEILAEGLITLEEYESVKDRLSEI